MMDPEWPATPGLDSIEGDELASTRNTGKLRVFGEEGQCWCCNFMRDNSNVQEFISQQLLEEIGGWGRQGEFPLSQYPNPTPNTPHSQTSNKL